ncbi:MAG TPA: isochorismatase family protein [Paenibacillus sp.]|nr:isochorismatase family protein [Paenibacillus sp.]
MKYAFEDHCWKDVVDEDILKIYKAYERETYIGRQPALLAIDLYNIAYQGGRRLPIELQDDYPSSCGVYAWDAIEPTKALFAAARSLGMPIVYSTSDTRMRKAGGRAVKATNRRAGAASEDAYDIFEAFKPQETDLIIYKSRASAFYGTPLTAQLTMMGVDSLIVCGESTSGCVRASAVDAYSHGYHTVVVEECCFDRSPISHKVSLFDLHHKYADVMHIDEALGHLSQRTKLKPA